MGKLYANIDTDEVVVNYLTNHYSDVVTIRNRRDGGLDIDVKSKSFHEDESDYRRIKNYLKRSGFTSFAGTHSREFVPISIRGDQFKLGYKPSDEPFDMVMKRVLEMNR